MQAMLCFKAWGFDVDGAITLEPDAITFF